MVEVLVVEIGQDLITVSQLKSNKFTENTEFVQINLNAVHEARHIPIDVAATICNATS